MLANYEQKKCNLQLCNEIHCCFTFMPKQEIKMLSKIKIEPKSIKDKGEQINKR